MKTTNKPIGKTAAMRIVNAFLSERGARRGRLSATTDKQQDTPTLTVIVHNWSFCCLPYAEQHRTATDLDKQANEQGFQVIFEL